MNTKELAPSLVTLFGELVDGAPEGGAFILNGGDTGLLNALDRITAGSASRNSAGGATVAAHVAHLAYGLSLMNRWAGGENPFGDADWAEAWRVGSVSEAEWAELRSRLRAEARRWLALLEEPREVDRLALNGMIASVGHLAYHLGALRQIEPQLRGPRERSGE